MLCSLKSQGDQGFSWRQENLLEIRCIAVNSSFKANWLLSEKFVAMIVYDTLYTSPCRVRSVQFCTSKP